MKNEKEILQLCVSNDAMRPSTETPFAQGEYVFATDGVIALRVSKNLIEGEYEERLQPNARSVFGQPENETEITLSAIKDLLSNVELIDEKRAVGEDVIDPCAGSGTTLLAAKQCGRKAYGFEIKKDFYKDAQEKVLRRVQTSIF